MAKTRKKKTHKKKHLYIKIIKTVQKQLKLEKNNIDVISPKEFINN